MLAAVKAQAETLRAEKAALEERYSERIHDIVLLTKEYSRRITELEAALEAERMTRNPFQGTVSFRSKIVLLMALPLLRPHLSPPELELYLHEPQKLFLNARHPFMLRLGRIAGLL